jgi:hypothetical protein
MAQSGEEFAAAEDAADLGEATAAAGASDFGEAVLDPVDVALHHSSLLGTEKRNLRGSYLR